MILVPMKMTITFIIHLWDLKLEYIKNREIFQSLYFLFSVTYHIVALSKDSTESSITK